MQTLGKLMAVAIAFGGLAAPAWARELTNAQRDAAIAFMLNNTRHTLLHEIGHLFVDQFELPVLGREEDAVDNFATLTMLAEGTPESLQALIDTVDGWIYSEQQTTRRRYSNSDFYGMHSLDIQRSFAMACLMVAHDYDRFTWFATRVGLPHNRQESCEEDLRLTGYGWESVLKPHVRAGQTANSQVSVVYRSHDPAYRDIAAILKQNLVLENTADWLRKTYVLPRPVRLTAEECGQVNAFYDPTTREVILCYEWADYFYELFISDIMDIREHFAEMRKLKLEKLDR
ncbi:DUF4344 domain-containing metallopeptidase [Pelagibacterium limicola]|uniref:DUF4344 domain-containing metallopeptidase n=1 Tax=Pelagibacterium limicola TaxID=2791022 RepID=UPI0018AFE09C|nr:DUF4344 domain-containing metallopeptidase [Pelagibacterium limicola]